MKDKVLTLKNKLQIYVADEVIYQNKRYVYGIECDNEQLELKNNIYILEAKVKEGKLVVDNVNDFAISSILNNIFTYRMAQANEEV